MPPILRGLERLLARADRVVHAGDPDREGQLIVDEVLLHLGYRGPVERLLVRDLRPEAIRAALGALEPNAKYRPLYESALGRQRADWLVGMNLSRLYTLLGRAGGYDGVLSVGRVQTPLLGLIVARDRAIASFRPVPYFVVHAEIRGAAVAATAASFSATWVPGPAAAALLDEDKRLLRREPADAVCALVLGSAGRVTARADERRTDAAPLPYSLADLQMDAGRRLGLTAQEVLDAAQSLYETRRLTTYPRSDCSHLPEAHFAQAPAVSAAIATHAPALARAASAHVDLAHRSKAWNDKKVTAHHAIIPTPSEREPPARLSEREGAVYELIATRYLVQFCAPHEYVHTKLELELAGERFVATGRQVLTPGWRALSTTPRDDEPSRTERDSPLLPPLARGDAVLCTDAETLDKKTEPPKAFTDASLIAAMCGVAKHVTDPALRKLLTETDGIGTSATRAAILETLVGRRFIARERKTIVSTATGRAFVAGLPAVATTPDLTAVWEAALRAIELGELALDVFLARVAAQIEALVAQGRALGRISVPMAASAPRSPVAAQTPTPRRRSRGARSSRKPRLSGAR
jgi:DNA topoisomerase-3